MKLCPINREKCMGGACGWSVKVAMPEERQLCAVAVIAANPVTEDGYYTANLNIQEDENELTTDKSK